MLQQTKKHFTPNTKILHRTLFSTPNHKNFTPNIAFFTKPEEFYTNIEIFYTKLMAVLGFCKKQRAEHSTANI